MTPNQRLIIAIVLSVGFFSIYTSIFPPKSEQDKITPAKEQVEHGQKVSQKSDEMVSNISPSSNNSTTILKVKSSDFTIEIDTLGRISSKIMLQDKYNDKDGSHAQLVDQKAMMPLFLKFSDESLNAEALKTPYVADVSEIDLTTSSSSVVTLTQNLTDISVIKKLTFYKDGHYDVDISLSKDKRYFVYLGQRPQLTKQMMTVVGAMVFEKSKDLITIVDDGKADKKEVFNDVGLISAFDQYNTTLMYGFSRDMNIVMDRDKESNPVIYIESSEGVKFNGYIGPKDHKILNSIDPILVNAIEYGWFTFAAKPLFVLLSYLHGIFGNWGWAIIGLTVIVRIVLFPLTHKGMVSMQKLKVMAPHLKEIQAKHKGDPQRLNAAMMEAYKKHGANPLGGCLPMLLQIPIFFAIYRVLLNAVELQGASWMLWVNDLSRMDPTFILPLLMGASMYFQQRLTPSNFTDPLQEKIFKFLPVIFTLFFLTFPSGLVLYWFVNNLFSISQQYIVNRQFQAKTIAK